MFLHRSNRAERLFDALCAALSKPEGADPFRPECIVVQSPGMARYLSMGLAERFGVWANPCFVYPRQLLEWAYLAATSEQGPVLRPPQGAKSSADWTWALAAELRVLPAESRFAPLQAYLEGDTHGDRLLQLAERVGGLFDEYGTYRDEMLAGWEAQDGRQPEVGEAAWQAELYRRVRARSAVVPACTQLPPVQKAIQSGAGLPGFPQRLTVFGVSTLPPLHARLLSLLAEMMPVHLFVLSPSREYWTDIVDERAAARTLRRLGVGPDEQADYHFDQGHPLLAALGTQGREFLVLLEALAEHLAGDLDYYEDPGADTVLQVVQQDLLWLRRRGEDPDAPRLSAPVEDRSIEIHVCHSPMRELEVLHDQLLWLFEEQGVRPEQVVVMAPDIESYAPLIQVVFSEHSGRTAIPFRVSDRSVGSLDPVVTAVAALLELIAGRLDVSALLDVLSLEVVRSRFGIAESDLPQLRAWAGVSGIRWGADASHRVEAGQPAFEQNTVRFGLERLLLGVSMSGHGVETFAGRLPWDGVEGSQAELLGRFAAYCEMVMGLRSALQPAMTPAAFAALGQTLIEQLIAQDEGTADARKRALEGLLEMASLAEAQGVTEPLATAGLRRLWLNNVGQHVAVGGFLAGGVTFCQLMPMRSIPFEVVVLLGMDDERFPRTQRPLSFDLRAAEPKPGDRRIRDDDRYLFLEALLSARRKLYISYVGRDIHDNSVRPPSVLVTELLAVLDSTFAFESTAAEALAVVHPLSVYSQAYFTTQPGDRRVSYAQHLCAGAARLLRPRVERPFMTAPLPALTEPGEVLELDLARFERYLQHPIRTMLQERLGLFLGQEIEPLAAREPIELDALSKYQIGEALLGQLLEAVPLAVAEQAAQARGDLPLGTPGQLSFRQAADGARALAELSARFTGEHAPLPRLDFTIERAGLRLSGTLDKLWPEQQVAVQYSRVGRRSELRLYARHVVANWLAQVEGVAVPTRSLLIGRGDKGESVCVWFEPVKDPEAVLTRLFALVVRATCFPLPLCEGPSRVYAEACIKQRAGKKVDPQYQAARAFADKFGPTEDPYIRLVYPSFEAFSQADAGCFGELAELLFGGLLDVRTALDGADAQQEQA